MANLGFIGMGGMGGPMAGRLASAGHLLSLFDLDPGKLKPLSAEGAMACPHAKGVAETAQILFLMLPDTPDVEAVLFGKNGAAEGLSPGKIVVDMGSNSGAATRAFAVRLAKQGVSMADAPVSGSPAHATRGELAIIVGAEPAVLERIKPYLEVMGKSIVHVGGNGEGQIAKAANQIIVALTREAVAEALRFAAEAGTDPRRVREAMLGGLAGSRILEEQGESMIEAGFSPVFRTHHLRKDLDNLLNEAEGLGLDLPCSSLVRRLYGGGSSDGQEEVAAARRPVA